MMNKQLRFPAALISGDCTTSSLVLNGGCIIDQCVAFAGESGTFFLEQHLLYVVLGGQVSLKIGEQEILVKKQEMVLLQKASRVSYRKQSSEKAGRFESLLFGITDELLKEFVTFQNVHVLPVKEALPVLVSPMSAKLVAYCDSLTPYFEHPEQINPGLLRLKIMELLYNVMDCSQNIFRQMLQLRQPVRRDVRRVVEDNLTLPATLDDLAYLSGRSLSSFKRDFQSIYGDSPARWIREQRLLKADEMLRSSGWSVSDVCYALGFENPTHFSRIYHRRFGYAPSAAKR